MKQLILLIGILFSLDTIGQRTVEVSVNIGAYYFWTPSAANNNITFSGTAGLNLKDKYVISAGLDFTRAYYDTFPYTGIYGEVKRIFKKETASPYVAIRYGGGLQNNKLTGNYFSPGVGIIEHFEHIDLQFSFNLKNHDHYSLKWVHGYEMRIGIIFKQ